MADVTPKKPRRKRGKLPQNVLRHRDKFRARVMRNGTLTTSECFATEDQAVDWLDRFEKAEQLAEHGAPLTIASAMELLRREQAANGVRPASVEFTEAKFKKICRGWPGDTFLHRIGSPQVLSYMAKRRKQEAAAQTIHHEVALLKRLFVIGKRNRRLLQSPFDDGGVRMPKVRNQRFDHLTREQVESILKRIRAVADTEPTWAWQADVFEFLFLTGLRRSELARLRVSDVDPFKGTITVKAKVDDVQVIHLAERTKAIVGRLIAAAAPDGHLVRSDEPDARKAEQSRANAITHLIMRWKTRLKLKMHGAAHVLRHSFGTELVKVPGMPFALAQRGMRHRTPAMTMRYFHESVDEMRAVAEAVASGNAFVVKKPRKATARPKDKQKPANEGADVTAAM